MIKTVVRRPNYFHRLGHFFPRFDFFNPYIRNYSAGKSRELYARNDIRSVPLKSVELAETLAGVRFDVALLDERGQEITSSSGQTSDQGAFEIQLTESLTAKVSQDKPFKLEISYPDADPWTAEFGILDHPPYVVSRRLWEAHRREQELIPKAVAGDEEATVELIGLWLTLPTEENAEDARNWLRELGRRNLPAERPATALLYLGMNRDLLEDPDSRVLGDIRNCTAEIIAGDEYTIAVVPASDTPSGEETELLTRFASYNWREAASAITRVDSPQDARIVVQISRATANIAPSTVATDEEHTYQDGMKVVDNPAYARALNELSDARSQLRMAESAAAANRAASQSLAASGGMNNMGRAAAIAGGAAGGASVALAQQAVRLAQAEVDSTPRTIKVENIVTRNLPTQTTTVRGYLTGEVLTKPNDPTIRAQRFPLTATVEVSDEHWDADPAKDFPANPLVLPSTDAVRTQLLDKGFEAVRDKVRDVLVSEAALRSLMTFDEAREGGERETIVEAGLRFLYIAGADHPDRPRVTREVEEHIGGLTGDKTTVGALITALRNKY